MWELKNQIAVEILEEICYSIKGMNENIDPIVAEVRKAREAYAKKFNYDIKAMCSDLKKRQAQNAKRVISLPPKRIKPMESI